jgi:hypothetical protein
MPPTPSRETKLVLDLSSQSAKVLTAALQDVTAEARRTEVAFDTVGKSLRSTQQEASRLQVLMSSPDARREIVRQQLEVEKLRAGLDKVMAQEKNRQQYGTIMGGVRNLFGIGTGGGQGDKEAPGALSGLASAATGAVAGLLAFKSVALASPASMQRFRLVAEDTAAVIGDRLRPVLEILTGAFRLLGDFLETILPSADEFRDILAPVTGFLSELRDALASIAPVVRDVLVVAFRALGVALNVLLIPIRFLVGFLQGLFGLSNEVERLKDSTGKAARSIQFGDPMAAVKSVYAAAYLGSAGAGADKQKSPLDGIGKDVSQAVKHLQAISQRAAEIGRLVGEFARQYLKPVIDAIETLVNEPGKVMEATGAPIEDFVREFIGAEKIQREPGLSPKDAGKAKTFDDLAKEFGNAKMVAGDIKRFLESGGGATAAEQKDLAASRNQLQQLIDSIRILAEKAGSTGKYNEEINELLKWAGMTSRRGIDGSAAGG